ncbi:type I-MYXAN CRISPR-associated protein Cas6/Cmx6 [Synechocystis sp. PCC 7339]|nr:type I-MYXAN CRISPR-associated protein Cas6/Cmx6 [Synechocystis sp. PCC 7338]UAJ74507.1 type I-MYXAN CRISPR-associated protein Cas6/Cmx6 [Synechocystis sp. PCC 7339]
MNFLELQFLLRGKILRADHGYALYSAIKQICQAQEIEISPEILISSIPGIGDKQGMIYLNRHSRFQLRCPAEQAQTWYRALQNQVLDIQGNLIRLIQPRLTIVQSQSVLTSRLVVIKLEEWNNHTAPQYFLESCQKGLERLNIQGQPFIESSVDGNLARRSLRIHGKHVMGFGVTVEGLSDEDSVKLQCLGLGGRGHFGCGWFYPKKEGIENVT